MSSALKSEATKLFYVVRSEMLDGGVIEAQVIASLRAHSKIPGQPRAKLIFLEPARVALGRKARRTLRAFRGMWPDGEIVVVPFVSRLGDSSVGRFLALYLARECFGSSEVVFHCRGPSATWSAHVARRLLGKGHVAFDLRGPHAYETIHRLGFPWPAGLSEQAERSYRVALNAERRAAAVADAVLTVSPGLKSYAVEVLGASENDVVVVPSCVQGLAFDQASRERVRAEWGVADSCPVFVYSGRLGPERLPRHMFRLFGAILRCRSDARLVLFLYRDDTGDLTRRLTEAGIPEASVLVASHSRDEVIDRLCGADVGMLFCEPALRYRSWFPIKFPEYLSAGLSVAINSLVGDLPNLVHSRGLGWIVDQDIDDVALEAVARGMLAQLNEDREGLRRRSLDTCSELYLWRNHIPAIRHAYGLTRSHPSDGVDHKGLQLIRS